MFEDIIKNVRAKTPLVHCITNYVTVNDVANILLACGGSPIMAQDAQETAQITALADALYLNIGTLSEQSVKSMLISARAAEKKGIPVVLDPVGAGASEFRTRAAQSILDAASMAIIRGNVSEIMTLAGVRANTKGVDAGADDTSRFSVDFLIEAAKSLSRTSGAVVGISGKTDIVTDGRQVILIKNGHSDMTKITGTGCMLTAVAAAYAGANPDNLTEALAAAFCAVGIAGERARERMTLEDAGNASLRTWFIDNMYKIGYYDLRGGAKYEIY
ncbi:MAG: hydroxyethylthiazole kinase [Clostridia bacterium]|nr:hydroxyethylthiazole kinase [Clostridia bacterium]